MSTLSEIKKMEKSTPNDQDLGKMIREYVSRHKSCCDSIENREKFNELSSGPYGWDVNGIKCKKCGKIIDIFNIDK